MTEINWNPLGLYYRVKITPPKEKTEGGIFLPDQEPWRCNDAVVVSRGKGRGDDPCRYLFQASVGERVLFERMDLEPGPNELEGAVSDEDIVGIVTEGYPCVQPCGEWLLISLWGRVEETKGGIAVPDRYQKRHRKGVVLDYGPGRLIKKGPKQGLRVTCGELLDLEPFSFISGYVIMWGRNAQLLQLSGEGEEYLIRAGDCIAVEENENG